MNHCKWCVDNPDWDSYEICTNSDCPACTDWCPTVNYPGLCRFEESTEKKQFTPPSIQITETNISYYDNVETHVNCTVQILTNTKTGEVSVGWWENTEERG